MKQRAGVSLLVLLFLATISGGQSPTAVVNGQVRDASGAAIAGATIEVFNDATHIRYSTDTNDEGIYSVPNLPPGSYHIQVSKSGFKTVVHPDITLNIQDAKAIGFTLPVGPISDTVTVEGGVTLVNTENASVSTVVDQTYIKNMPLNGRSFQDLILLTPGVVTQTPQVATQASASPTGPPTGVGVTGEFSINGQRPESNYYTVDGVSANVGASFGTQMQEGGGPSGSVPGATALGTTQALVSVDDLQEFRVQSSTYSAEYGRNPGGQFAFETKSGTNQWHGTAYDYLRNGASDARDWFNDYFHLPEPAIRQNDFGGTLGGPVKIPRLYNGKDKTFFFFSYEGLRLVAPQPAASSLVPDLCLRGAAAMCPAGINPAVSGIQPVLNAFPIPNGPEVPMTVSCDPTSDPACSPGGTKQVPSGFATYLASWSNPSSLDSTSVRFDQIVNDKLRLFFRFSDTASSSATRGQGGSTASMRNSSPYTMRTYTAGASSVFTNRFSNDFRFNYSSNETIFGQVIDAFGGSTPVDLRQLSGLGAGSTAVVLFLVGGSPIQFSEEQLSGAQRQWNFVDAAALSLGRHQFKFGADYRRLAPFATLASPVATYVYLSESAVQSNSALTQVQANAPSYPLYVNFSAFAQDEWKASQRLSLSLGLRWEVNPAPGVTQGLKPYTVQTQGSSPDTWTLAPRGTPLWQTTWFNFAPRIGAAYILRNPPSWETVVRGGGGVFFDTGQQLGSLSFVGPGFGADTPFQPASFPISAGGQVPAIPNPPLPPFPQGIYGFAPHLQLPYTLQWNASIEQALGKSQALTLSYVAAHASRLLQENVFEPSNNPITSSITLVQNSLTSDYGSLQVQFRRRLSRGLTALASYTWAHCLDYGSQNYIIGYQRGNCDFDVRNNLSAAFSYDLPNVGHNGLVNAVLHHWGLDDRFTARTGFPVTLTGNGLLQPNGQFFDQGLNLVQGQPIYLYGANCATVLQGLGDLQPGQGCPGGRAINPNTFVNVSSGLGNAPRNFARGFGAWQMDLAVRRDFPIHERLKLQFRAEAFNTFNHPNFGAINGALGQPTFGQATGTLANSLGVLNPLYQMGGPRSMQFALKLVF